MERWFETQLKEKRGYIIKQMGEDGACLFRAVGKYSHFSMLVSTLSFQYVDHYTGASIYCSCLGAICNAAL